MELKVWLKRHFHVGIDYTRDKPDLVLNYSSFKSMLLFVLNLLVLLTLLYKSCAMSIALLISIVEVMVMNHFCNEL